MVKLIIMKNDQSSNFHTVACTLMPLGFKVSGIEYLRYQNSFAIFFYIHEEIKPSPCLIMILHHWQLKTQVMHIRNSVVSSTLRIKREHKKIVL